MYRIRQIELDLDARLKAGPAVCLLGPRQCGKTTLITTLVKKTIKTKTNAVYLDLERPSDLKKLENPEVFFEYHSKSLVCLDEIQRYPNLFTILRGIIDCNKRKGQFIFLGSASQDLLQQSSESLAGRISYLELTPFLLTELEKKDLKKLWIRGGFPRSFLASSNLNSYIWRKDFIRTFIEKDLPQLGSQVPAHNITRFWTMMAHIHGQILNTSQIGNALGVSHNTIRSYAELLEKTLVLRVLQPYYSNVKKRLIKSPKVYIRDSGVLHALLDVENFNHLLGHPNFGSSWEGFVIENIITKYPNWQANYLRTSYGNEIDLVLTKGHKIIAIECKATKNPSLNKGFHNLLEEFKIKKAYVVALIDDPYPISKKTWVYSLWDFLTQIDLDQV